MNLTAETAQDCLLIHVEGPRIDAAVAIRFKDDMRDLTDRVRGRVVLNLAGVDFIDSSGLGAIVAAMKQLPGGAMLELANLMPNVDRVFRLTRMDSVFTIHDRLEVRAIRRPDRLAAAPPQGRPARPGDATAIVLCADPMAVRDALGVVVAKLGDFGLGVEELGSVELVLAEALNNIVEHAYADAGAGEIRLSWHLDRTGLHVRIVDDGQPMPDGQVPLSMSRGLSDHAALMPEGGFGWFLIAGLAHDIQYHRDGGTNVLTFRMMVGDGESAVGAA